MQCLVLAGGLGTRMWPSARRVPKTLLEVAGRPFAAWQLEWLRAQDVRRVVYSVGYLGDQVESYVGDGSRWRMSVTYVREGDELLGTGGALRLAADQGALEPDFFVLYGDSYLQVELTSVERAYRSAGLPALMTVYRNAGRWERSNVSYSKGAVTRYDKARPHPGMEYVDYGLLVLSRRLVEQRIAPGLACDVAPVLRDLSIEGQLAGFEAPARFYEIGSPGGLADLESHLVGAGACR